MINGVDDAGEETLDENQAALVMVHGLGAGGALFALNFDGLAKHFTVYSIDLPGNKCLHNRSFPSMAGLIIVGT